MKTKVTTKLMIALLTCSVAVTAGVMAGSCGSQQKDIVDTAVEAGDFDTLVADVQAAGLVEVLKGDGPFTVIAPTDEAFAKLPEGTLEALLADKEALTAVLAAEAVTFDSAKTVQGREVRIDNSDSPSGQAGPPQQEHVVGQACRGPLTQRVSYEVPA